MPSLQEKVLSVVATIPKGKVATYAQIAKTIGHPRAFRAVGNALNKNPRPLSIPCHRVVRSSGDIGGYIFGRMKKETLLKKEGVRFDERGRVVWGCIMEIYGNSS